MLKKCNFLSRICLAGFLALSGATGALADEVFSSSNQVDAKRIVVRVDVSEQKMTVIQGGKRIYDWDVSTARAGKETPRGTYQPQFFSPNHRSSLYGGAPMPWSVFYDGDYAIHGTNQISRLGSPASAGCVRLHPDHAKALYAMIWEAGKDETFIVVQD